MEHINGFIKDSIKQVLQNELEAIQFQSDAERVAFCNNDQLKRAIASSQYISDTLKKYPQIIPKLLLAFDSPDVFHPFQLSMALDVSLDIIKQELRKYRCMSLAYIGVLDIAGVYSVTKTISELSEVADKCIKYAASWAMKNSATQIGTAYDNDGCAQKIIIIALGKLGGRELNFSSDVDLCFAYPPTEHFVAKNTRASVEDAYLCIARTIVDLLADNNEYSFVYRVDLKLRPFGDSGPIVMDVNDMEDYYQRYGRDWERYALIKARPIYGDINECRNLMAKFRPFVYRRYMDFGVFESLREMKTLIESEINRKDKHDDIKIGRGGIRQIEFIAQSFQLVRGGKDPIFQQRSLLKALEIIKKYKYISREEYDWLLDSYLFLRKTENALQMLHEQQTHTLPDLELDKNRLCIALNFVSWNDFVDVLNNHRDLVSNLFNKIVAPPIKVIEALPNRIRIGDIWAIIEDKDKCIKELKKCVPTDYELIYKELLSFRSRIDNKQFGYRTRKRLKNLIPEVINISIRSQDPVQALNRLISLVESIGRRSLYISLMLENPNVLQLIIDLCTKSEWVHAQLCKFPILLDELLDYRRNRDISIGNLHNELKLRLQWVDSDDLEHQMECLREFKLNSTFRIAVADVMSDILIKRVSDHLTDIAQVILKVVTELALEQTSKKYNLENILNISSSDFAIIAYGKLGGIELSYSSDLDVVFLYDKEKKNSELSMRKVDIDEFYIKLGQRIYHLLNTATSSGPLYTVDMRLRPLGDSGLLVTSFDSFAEYQRNSAWTWEHQALVRARVIVANDRLTSRFNSIRREILSRVRCSNILKHDITSMRTRMMQSKTYKIDKLKLSAGGINDIEFIVQYYVLRWSVGHPLISEHSDNMRIIDSLVATGILSAQVAEKIRKAYLLYRDIIHKEILYGKNNFTVDKDIMTENLYLIKALWSNIFSGHSNRIINAK